MIIQIKSLGGKIPKWSDDIGTAGLDLYANEDAHVAYGNISIVPCGICTAFNSTLVAIIRDRSGLAVKSGLHTLAGVIDSSYRGEWKVVCTCLALGQTCIIKRGDRIAQALFIPSIKLLIQKVSELPDSMRGEKGFGSTGK